jgi:Arc/MetJ-type ribon-helix-helix transcriptional regulator
MNISLSPELERLIQSQLQTNQYQSPEEVLEAALKLLVETQKQKASLSPWDTLEEMAGTIEAPEDWSSEHDHYLYGTPKRNSHHE